MRPSMGFRGSTPLTRALCLVLLHLFAPAFAAATSGPPEHGRPNVVIVLADDMGYGDVSCYDPGHNKVPTPRIDALARQGMRFTDAHATSSVCSPSRYSLLT